MADAVVRDRKGEFALQTPAAATPSESGGGSVGRTLAVLRALHQLGPGAHPLASVATRAGLPAPTAHRYVQALVGEGAVQRQGPRGHYSLVEAPHLFSGSFSDSSGPPTGTGSATLRAELITLQSRTGHIALAYVPLLIGTPMRIHAEQALGAHAQQLQATPHSVLQALWRAPLEADPAGWAIQACVGDVTAARPQLARIRQEGYALGPSLLLGRDAIAAPFWRGSTVAGAVSLLAAHSQVRSPAVRNRFIWAVLDAAAMISRQLTRAGVSAPAL
ncbi:helix-turn-helix domain-containing protein [Streptomyces sp. NBC_01283]|uniref:helix-turn-helix domain-containing protein n=1 Tax=Streptomyces sp. NBC_01283 TaxID=2903812 RepID=UPI00352E1255|nr:helix-turn-helix domain-containing protein [Streptomyces sp. NBC_01283]